jgi:hypothetical protein
MGYELPWNTNKLIRNMFNNLLTDTSQRDKLNVNSELSISKYVDCRTSMQDRHPIGIVFNIILYLKISIIPKRNYDT